ncbi:unnamed protein product [Merluccius merluccius]
MLFEESTAKRPLMFLLLSSNAALLMFLLLQRCSAWSLRLVAPPGRSCGGIKVRMTRITDRCPNVILLSA